MRGVLLLVLTLLPGCAIHPNGNGADAPIPTTIQAVDAKPEQYRGKFIAVRGLIGDCWSRGGSCRMQQTTPGALLAAHAPSMSINFMSPPEALAPSTDPDSGVIAGYLMNELYRFSEVTLVGRYDGGCTSNPDPRPGKDGMEEIVVCYDGFGSDLKVTSVTAVHKRWPATAFSADADEDDRLTVPPPATAKQIDDAHAAARRSVGEIVEDTDEHRIFLRNGDQDAAVLCVCRTQSCADAWPSLRAHLFPAPANPYYCVDAERTGGTWHFAPGSR